MSSLDKQIDKGIQQREIGKVREAFYDQMRSHYMIRKSKEFITLKCSDLCFKVTGNNFYDDELDIYYLQLIFGPGKKRYAW